MTHRPFLPRLAALSLVALALRQGTAAAAPPASTTPPVAARNGPPGNPCALAVAARLAADGGETRRYWITYVNHGYVATAAEYSANLYAYDLSVEARANGTAVARATCWVSASGQVAKLRYVPIALPGAVLAAR